MSEWISVKDELPPFYVSIIVCCKNAYGEKLLRPALRIDNGDFIDEPYIRTPTLRVLDNVTHWCSFPSLPENSGDRGDL